MNLYLIQQDVHNDYDTYDSAVVCADNEEEARRTHPDGRYDYAEPGGADNEKAEARWGTWAKKEYVKVQFIGLADVKIGRGVVISSFNAG